MKLAAGPSYRKAASLFGLLCSLSVFVTIFVDQNDLVFISTAPFFVLPLIVTYLYGELRASIYISIGLGCLLLATPFLGHTISLEMIVAPTLLLLLTTGFLAVAHYQRLVEKKVLSKERERSLHDMRLRSMGELTANIAHQMGTPLTVIEMAIENARENFAQGRFEQAMGQLQVTEDTIFKSKRFIDTLKNLYQPQQVTHGSCNLSWIISQVRLFYGPKLAKQRVVLTAPSENLHQDIPIPGEDLLQCVLNLVDNGLHALKGQANASIKLTLKCEEEALILIYSDNGPGIAQAGRDKIFDPFYTTKDLGEGTGLGLAITQAILRRHDAEITLVRESGTGASFKIVFKRR